MVCIYCSSPTGVTNSRHQKRVNTVWRRRHCSSCAATFTTIESPDLASVLMVQRGQRLLEPFERDRLFVSVYESCKHRPTALADATGLLLTITANVLHAANDGTIERNQLATIVHETLERFDSAAATVYGAYHRLP